MKKKEYNQILSLCDEELANDASTNTAECLLLRGTFRLLQGMGGKAQEDLEKLVEMEELSPQVRSDKIWKILSIKVSVRKSNEIGYLRIFLVV